MIRAQRELSEYREGQYIFGSDLGTVKLNLAIISQGELDWVNVRPAFAPVFRPFAAVKALG